MLRHSLHPTCTGSLKWVAFAALWLGASCAQAQAVPASSTSGSSAAPVEQKFERIVHEDGGSRVEEERLGGITRRIQIESKLGGKPYEVIPDSGPNNQATGWNGVKDSAGKAVWRIGIF